MGSAPSLHKDHKDSTADYLYNLFEDSSLSQDDLLSCSFCRKTRDAVVKLIANPAQFPRSYICYECVAVCASIIEDDRSTPQHPVSAPPPPDALPHPLLDHPLASPFLEAVELWVKRESLGEDAADEFAEVRRLAGTLVRG